MISHRTKDLVLLILQFLEEEGYHAAARSLEIDSGFYFDMDYFEVVLHGHWDEAEKYLSGFTKYDDNIFSSKTYFEMRKHKYIEALDKHDHAKVLQILNRDLKVFASDKEELFKEMTQLLTLDNIRQSESLESYIDESSARKSMVKELKKLIKANPLFEGKLKFPKMKKQRLRCLINQGFNWQLKHLRSKNPQIKDAFVEHACQSLTDLLSQSAENSFEELSPSMEVEDLLHGWPCIPTTQISSCKDDLHADGDLGDGGNDMKSNEVVTTSTESTQLYQREVTDLPKHVIWTFTEDSSPTSIDFHPTKPYDLLVAMDNGDIGLWDVYWRKKLQSINLKVWNVGACSMAFTAAAMMKDPHMSINRIAWSPDGSLFGVAYSKYMVQLFHYLEDDTIQQHIEIDAPIGAVNDLAFLIPNQQRVLITCGDDLKIKVWDAVSGANVFAFEGHTAPIYSICPYTKEGNHFIFSTSLDGDIKVWKYDDFGVRGDYDAPVHGSTTIIPVMVKESFLVEWEFDEGAIKRMYKGLGTDCLDSISFDTIKNKYLAVGDEHMVKFWDMDSTELLTTTDAAGNLPARPCICFNFEGTLLSVIAKEKEIKILASDCPPDFITLQDMSEEFRDCLGAKKSLCLAELI